MLDALEYNRDGVTGDKHLVHFIYLEHDLLVRYSFNIFILFVKACVLVQ